MFNTAANTAAIARPMVGECVRPAHQKRIEQGRPDTTGTGGQAEE